MKIVCFLVLIAIGAPYVSGQQSIQKTLEKWNDGSVPYVSVAAASKTGNSLFLDAREKDEYDVSHLENAIWIGHKAFQADSVLGKITDHNTPLVVYCSIGVRSEDIGKKLMALGYTNIKNLYGGIFEWKNKGYPVFDPMGKETEKVHAFNKHWGKLLVKGEKVYGVDYSEQ